MTDNWDDGSDDEWDVDDDALDAKLGIKKDDDFDDEEDLALKEKAEQDKANQESLKKKGSALAAKKQEEKDRNEEAEIARKAMELEAEFESKLSVGDRNVLERQRQEEGEMGLIDDAFGGGIPDGGVGSKGSQLVGDKIVLKDMKDHMKHARRVAEAMKVRMGVSLFVLLRCESGLRRSCCFVTVCCIDTRTLQIHFTTGPWKDSLRIHLHQRSD